MRLCHLLLIEDDPDIVHFLSADLIDAGYRVSSAASVRHGLIRAHELAPDLVITDLGLPDGDGTDLVRRLRVSSQVPIVVLSARDQIGIKVELLEAGANDYLVKPFESQELLATIDARLTAEVTDRLVVGELSVQPSRHLATWAGKDLRLSPEELALLTLLMQQPGRVITRYEMTSGLQDGSNADVQFCTLKEKLRTQGVSTMLRTVRGLGYAIKEQGAATPPQV